MFISFDSFVPILMVFFLLLNGLFLFFVISMGNHLFLRDLFFSVSSHVSFVSIFRGFVP